MLIDRCKLQAGHNVLIWGAAGGLGVFATQLCKAAGANAVGVVSSAEKGELVKQLGAVDYIDRNEFSGHDAQGRRDRRTRRRRASRSRARFAKRVKEILGDAPDIVFEHVGQATFPTSVFTVKPFGKVVICGATSGYTLDFDVRYLWMKQKEILGSHFANAYECMKANQLMAEGKIRPVLSAGDGLRGRPRGAPDDAREPALRQDHDPRRRDRRRAGQDRRRRGRDLGRGRRLEIETGARRIPADARLRSAVGRPRPLLVAAPAGRRRRNR